MKVTRTQRHLLKILVNRPQSQINFMQFACFTNFSARTAIALAEAGLIVIDEQNRVIVITDAGRSAYEKR